MRKTLLLLTYILLFALFGCSHKYGINKNYAFTRTITAGNIPVDEQGRPQTRGIKRTYLVYLELQDSISKPQWDSAWIQGEAFVVEPLKIGKDSITVGKTTQSQKTITIGPSEGYVLWQLLLTPLLQSPQTQSLDTKPSETGVILSGVWKGERVQYTIKNLTELERVFME